MNAPPHPAAPPLPPPARPAALYVHVPFCMKRCAYCAFFVVEHALAPVREAYLRRLAVECAAAGPRAAPLRSIFLGGGTPTYLKPPQLAELLVTIRRSFPLAPDCEFTVEGNPETYSPERVRVLLDAGVNRFSIGVQSFDEARRRRLGRIGKVPWVPRAFEHLRAGGARNLNADLIYGVPGQTLAEWEDDLRRLLALAPDHVSTYSLSIEEGAPLAAAGAVEVDDETLVDMWRLAGDVLGAAGLPRYEVSNFARPDYECRHNLHCWRSGTYLGAGPAACWYDGQTRWSNPADLARWLAGEPPAADPLPPAARAVEALVIGLRTVAGWTAADFRAATGHEFAALRGPALAALAADGLLHYSPAAVRPTERGLLLADYVGRELL